MDDIQELDDREQRRNTPEGQAGEMPAVPEGQPTPEEPVVTEEVVAVEEIVVEEEDADAGIALEAGEFSKPKEPKEEEEEVQQLHTKHPRPDKADNRPPFAGGEIGGV